jgi:hypothetical protein
MRHKEQNLTIAESPCSAWEPISCAYDKCSYLRNVKTCFCSLPLGEGPNLSPAYFDAPAGHLISIFKVAANDHAPLDSDLIEPDQVVITGTVEIDDTTSSRVEDWSLQDKLSSRIAGNFRWQ